MVSRIYDRIAEHYDEDWSGLYARARAYCINQIVSQSGALDGAPDIVDLGIGTGAALRDLRQRIPLGYCTGFDVSRGMLSQAAQNLNGKVKLIHDDATRAASYLQAESQDLALCHFLLDFADVDPVLDTVQTLLRPGGFFSLATSTQQSLSEVHRIHYPRSSRLIGIQRAVGKSNTPINHRQCLERLEKSGFEIVAEKLQRQPVCFESFIDVRCWALDSGWAASFLDDSLGIRKLCNRAAFIIADMLIPSFYPFDATSEISIVLARKRSPTTSH